MNKTGRLVLLICLMLVLLLLLGCDEKLLVLSETGDDLFDGEYTYKHMPDQWRFLGDLKTLLGRRKDGVKVYSNESGQFAKEKDSPFKMAKPTYVREDFNFPELYGWENNVTISWIGTWKRKDAFLPETEKKELFSICKEIDDMAADFNLRDIGFHRIAEVYFDFPTCELRYFPNLSIWRKDDQLFLHKTGYHDYGYLCRISESTFLYSFIMEYI